MWRDENKLKETLYLYDIACGMKLKIHKYFGKALATKSLWRLISKEGLWKQVNTQKYIEPYFVEEWIRKPNKTFHIVSTIWKDVVLSFTLVESWLAWRVGNGEKVRVDLDR